MKLSSYHNYANLPITPHFYTFSKKKPIALITNFHTHTVTKHEPYVLVFTACMYMHACMDECMYLCTHAPCIVLSIKQHFVISHMGGVMANKTTLLGAGKGQRNEIHYITRY